MCPVRSLNFECLDFDDENNQIVKDAQSADDDADDLQCKVTDVDSCHIQERGHGGVVPDIFRQQQHAATRQHLQQSI